MLVAIYARHSTDKQEGSTTDQIARCKQFCQQRGYGVSGIFCDEGVSGAFMMNRPGLKRLLAAAIDGEFDRIVTEDLSRISRDQADTAVFFKKMSFVGVPLETISEGIIGELHIGLKSTMNALYLKDLADKTRRGQIASVLKGAVPGGQTYGYDMVRRFDARGDLIRGARVINEDQAAIIRQVFADYAAGNSLKHICRDLNALGVPSPAGGQWQPTTLCGTAARLTGILRQTLYKGVITFNKMHFRKHPETGRRVSVPRPRREWVQAPIPELAIVDEALFDQVQEMIVERSSARRTVIHLRQLEDAEAKAAREAARVRTWRRQQAKAVHKPLAVFSGRLYCATHGRKMVTQRSRVYGCPEHGCRHRLIRWDEIMPLCLDALGRLSAADFAAYRDDPAVVAQRANHEAAMAAAARSIEGRRAAVRNVLAVLGARARTETVRQVLEEHEQEIRSLTWERIKHERRRDALDPTPEAVDGVLAAFRKRVTHLRVAPDDHRQSVAVRACIDRFSVDTIEDGPDGEARRTVTAAFNIPKLLDLVDDKKG